MRKRTVNYIAITCFWYVIYFLPVLSYLLYLFIHPSNQAVGLPIPFVEFCSNVGFSVLTDNIVYSSLYSIFGTGGVLPFISFDGIYIILTWYVATFFMHIFVDSLLFIPKWAHDFMNRKDKGDL